MEFGSDGGSQSGSSSMASACSLVLHASKSQAVHFVSALALYFKKSGCAVDVSVPSG